MQHSNGSKAESYSFLAVLEAKINVHFIAMDPQSGFVTADAMSKAALVQISVTMKVFHHLLKLGEKRLVGWQNVQGKVVQGRHGWEHGQASDSIVKPIVGWGEPDLSQNLCPTQGHQNNQGMMHFHDRLKLTNTSLRIYENCVKCQVTIVCHCTTKKPVC